MDNSVVIAFDFDGVIADSVTAHYNSFIDLLKLYGHTNLPTRQEYLNYLNGNFWEMMAIYGFTKEKWPEISKTWRTVSQGMFDAIQPFPGMNELFLKAQDTYPTVIITSNTSSLIHSFFKIHSVENKCGVYGSDYHLSKLHKLLELQEKYPSSIILFVTDTVGDIKEGLAANVTCIGVTWGFHSADDLKKAGAHLLVNNADELAKALGL